MKKLMVFICMVALTATMATAQHNAMLGNALKLIDTPYAANTLEVTDVEELIINGDQMDCTTFVEFVLAMSLCKEQGDEMQESEFADYLQKIRYRDGKIEGYTSRLHYITEWIGDNVKKGLIEDVTATQSPVTTTVNVSFMSTHPDKYVHLKNSPENVAAMAAIEKRISGQKVHYLPKNVLPYEGLKWIKNGDIIAFTTNIDGLDVAHLGIAIYVKDNLHVIHASSQKGKVIVDELALNRQLARNKKYTGIRVLRMKEKN